MIFEFIYSSSKLYHKPHFLFFEAIFLTIISVFLSLFIFPNDYLSFGILMFLTLGSIPIFAKLFTYNSYISCYHKSFIKRHSSLLTALGYFFLGVFVSFVGFFFLLSINYNLETYDVNDIITVSTSTQDYSLKISEINDDNIRVILYQENQPIRQGVFYKGQYVDFKGYELDRSFLITDINTKVTFSVGNGVRENIFFVQLKERKGIDVVRSSLTGQIINKTNNNNFSNAFSLIFRNNLDVIIKATIMSFFYGAGALFLIAWNASVLASVVALDIFVSMAPLVSEGLKGLFIGFINSLYLFIGYLPHGLPELLAYFLVSFAGAMFARDLFKGLLSTEFRYRIIKDLFLIFFFALLLLFVGAIIEASYFI